MMLSRRELVMTALATGFGVGARARESGGGPTVFAAASLTEVLQDLANSWASRGGAPLTLSFAASSALARQIEAGARADLFFSADEEWMDYLAARNLIRVESRRVVATNTLVLIAPSDSAVQVAEPPAMMLGAGSALTQAFTAALGAGRLAVADTTTVPAGRYARAALTHLGLWALAEPRLASAENVRAALAFVARGEVPLGIVYRTDARAEPRVRVVGVFPAESHAPIVYPVALTTGASPQAAQFLDAVSGPDGRAAFARFGFGAPRRAE